MVKKWRIIFYPHLHPIEPRCHAEVQFTRRRIYIFTKHKRHNKVSDVIALYHEIFHIIVRRIFHKQTLLDECFDSLSYEMSKQINKKAIIKEKGWSYYLKSSRATAYSGEVN